MCMYEICYILYNNIPRYLFPPYIFSSSFICTLDFDLLCNIDICRLVCSVSLCAKCYNIYVIHVTRYMPSQNMPFTRHAICNSSHSHDTPQHKTCNIQDLQYTRHVIHKTRHTQDTPQHKTRHTLDMSRS